MLKGKRKFISVMIALAIFTVALIVHPNIDPQRLGMGLGVILFGFGIPNMAEHLSKKGR